MDKLTDGCDRRIQMFNALDRETVPVPGGWMGRTRFELPQSVLCEHGYHKVTGSLILHDKMLAMSVTCDDCGIVVEAPAVRLGLPDPAIRRAEEQDVNRHIRFIYRNDPCEPDGDSFFLDGSDD